MKQLEAAANRFGFTFENRARNVHMVGSSAGDAIKMFASQGCDVVRDGDNYWVARDQRGQFVGHIMRNGSTVLATTSCIH